MHISPAILATQPFLIGMAPRQLELLAENSMAAEFQPDELIMCEGGLANRFYLILEGRIQLESAGPAGEPVPIQILGPGDVLGWSWFFPPYYWHFNARATVPTRAIFFYGTHLRELCEENHDFGYALMLRISEIVIKRLQATRRELVKQNLTSPARQLK